MFKHVQPLNGQSSGIAEALLMTPLRELIDRFDDQASVDQAGFLQFCDVPPDRDKPASI
jgi:hypothetical protein